ncbi:MAG: adenine phosphoribosyltransferase [Candidatus Dormibacteria bacterium]
MQAEKVDPQPDLRQFIRDIPDYPVPGVLFRDITPLLGSATAFRSACDRLAERYRGVQLDLVATIESRGFTFGAVLAYQLGLGVVPVRKAGKLPAETISASYDLEYGKATLEVHRDAIKKGQRVLVVDDLLATGGTATATRDLILELGGELAGYCFLIELLALGGRSRLGDARVETVLEL